eukprot:2897274-Prymnesium_polylepis.3
MVASSPMPRDSSVARTSASAAGPAVQNEGRLRGGMERLAPTGAGRWASKERRSYADGSVAFRTAVPADVGRIEADEQRQEVEGRAAADLVVQGEVRRHVHVLRARRRSGELPGRRAEWTLG